MRPDNSHYLLAAAQRRRADTLERARKALQELGETGQRRTVTQIAALAGVSRSWLCAQTDLREHLRQLTDQHSASTPAVNHTQRSSDASLRQRLTLAHARIHELDDQNRQLRDQIAHLHGHLRASRLGSNHVADTFPDTNTQNH